MWLKGRVDHWCCFDSAGYICYYNVVELLWRVLAAVVARPLRRLLHLHYLLLLQGYYYQFVSTGVAGYPCVALSTSLLFPSTCQIGR